MFFKAYGITNEIDLNKIATLCNIPKKYTWEEPLCIHSTLLQTILNTNVKEDQKVFLFSFGSVVFINFQGKEENIFLEYLKSIRIEIDIKNFDTYNDDYELQIHDGINLELTDKYVVVSKFELYYPELIATVLAKSVALERTEEMLGKILDNLENMIDKLERGKLNIGNKEIAKTTSTIVRHQYNTIAYIMILDKPDITWINSDAENLYNHMSEFFELNDRFIILKEKTNILNNIIDGFSSISHSIRGLFVEWVIVILIMVEVVLMVADLLK